MPNITVDESLFNQLIRKVNAAKALIDYYSLHLSEVVGPNREKKIFLFKQLLRAIVDTDDIYYSQATKKYESEECVGEITLN